MIYQVVAVLRFKLKLSPASIRAPVSAQVLAGRGRGHRDVRVPPLQVGSGNSTHPVRVEERKRGSDSSHRYTG